MVDVIKQSEDSIVKNAFAPQSYDEIFQPQDPLEQQAGATPAGATPVRKKTPNNVIDGNTLRCISGYIGGAGGWVIKKGSLTAKELGIATQEGNTTHCFWAGNDTPAFAEFNVTHVGVLSATGAIISGTITATAGAIGGWSIDATRIYSANINIDSANHRIRSSGYVAGVSGFTIEPSLIESENIVGRATLHGAVFSYDIVSAIGGQLLVTNADSLAVAMTALDNSTLKIKGDTTFAVNDILLVRAVTALGIQEEYFRVLTIPGNYNVGDTSPGTAADSASVGTIAWTTVDNIKAVGGGYAWGEAVAPGTVITHYIKATNFGFSVPTGATIAGIEVKITRAANRQDAVEYVIDSEVKLIKSDSTLGSENKADLVTKWEAHDTLKTYGSSSNLWSETLTPSVVNSANFGVALSASITDDGSLVAGIIDHVQINVYYTIGSGTYLVTRDLASTYAADTNPIWKAGTAVVKVGKSDGAAAYSGGWLHLLGEGTNSPHYSVFKRTGVAYNAYTEYCRLGNLKGFLGYSSDEYGIAIGEATKYLKYDPTNGLKIAGNIQTVSYQTAGEDLTAGDSVQIGGTYVPQPSFDTWVSFDDKAVNYNSATTLQMWNYFAGSFALIKFDLSSFINIGDNVTSAVFSYYLVTAGNTQTLKFIQVTADWTSSTVTWNTKPTLAGAEFATASAETVEGWKTQDITTQVKNWIDGTWDNYGMGVSTYDLTKNGAIHSIEGTNKPYLTITMASGKVYKASALTSNATGRWLGLVVETTSAEASAPIQVSANATYLAGLTIESPYYQSDTRGTISTSPGTVSKKIGLSITATELLILNN